VRPLLLDLDGTLVDSAQDLASAVNALLEELGLQSLPQPTLMSFVGRGARSLVRRAIEEADPSGAAARDESVLRRFLGHYKKVMLEHTVPFPGVVTGLEQLSRAGVPMAIVSNKPEEPTLVIAEALGLSPFFGAILGGDSTNEKKPSALPLRLAAERLKVPLADCVMVGDSDVDIEAARAAKIPGVWVTWGGIHPDRPARAEWVASSFDVIVDIGLGRRPSSTEPGLV
jgi:phosphoglycolate phosphatase